ncbi:MAG: transcriptional repressor [Clostridia bacterium]|nr:transcriptional repressor [Clostridia bacterium]
MSERSSIGYKTRQRERILEFIKSSGDCVTAEEIIVGLGALGENVSKPTVYRTLDHFVKNGYVTRFVSEKGDSSTYRISGESHAEHFHIKCTECKKTVCVDCTFIHSIESHILEHHGFTLSPNQTVFYGVCAQCREQENRGI